MATDPIDDEPPQIHANYHGWPVVVLTPRGPVTTADVGLALVDLDHQAHAHDQPYALIWDLRSVGMLSALERDLVIETLADHHSQRLCVACTVIPGAVLQDDFDPVMFWADPPPYAFAHHRRLRAAMEWAAQCLASLDCEASGAMVRIGDTQKIPAIQDTPLNPLERTPEHGEIILRAPTSSLSVRAFQVMFELRKLDIRAFVTPARTLGERIITWLGPYDSLAEAEAVGEELAAHAIVMHAVTWPETLPPGVRPRVED